MSASVNNIVLIGNVGSDAEMRLTPTGVPVTSFSLAVNKTIKSVNGEMRNTTRWYKVVCWRKLAEIVDQYVKKGMLVYVEGEPDNPDAWIDRDGKIQSRNVVNADEVKFLTPAPANGHQAAHAAPEQEPAEKAIADVDIPF